MTTNATSTRVASVTLSHACPLQFLRAAYQPDDWVAVFLKSYETGQTGQRVGPVALVADRRFQAWLRWRNLNRWNVYVSVNVLAPDSRARTREAVRAIRHVFLEADHDGAQTLAAIEARRDLPPPSYVLQSSPNRVHVFWRAAGFTGEAVEALQRLLARQLGTDAAATPRTQTTRLPGFMNHKRQPPHLVTVEYRDTRQCYGPGDFPRPTAARTLVHRSPPRTTADPIERARRYLLALPPAVSGDHGDLQTFRVCCRLVRGFALSDRQALVVLGDWNARCVPPWSDRELVDKVRRARRYGREPIGGLLGSGRTESALTEP